MAQAVDLVDGIDPDRIFRELAIQYRLLPDDRASMSEDLWGYTMAVVTLCSEIADAPADAQRGGPAGKSVRAALLDYRTR